MPDMINPLDILEKAGIDKFCINYAKKSSGCTGATCRKSCAPWTNGFSNR